MFDPNQHITQIKTKRGPADYLAVQWRLVWFREQCPEGSIETELVHFDPVEKLAVFRAKIFDGKGGSATGHGSETAKDFDDYLEKAETKSVGRALAALGFGTQFAPELEEGERIADAPVERKTRDQALHDLAKPGPARMGNGDGTVRNTLHSSEPSPNQLSEIKRLANLLNKSIKRPATYKEADEMLLGLAREYNASPAAQSA